MKNLLISMILLLPSFGYSYSMSCTAVTASQFYIEVHDSASDALKKTVLFFDGDQLKAQSECDILLTHDRQSQSIICQMFDEVLYVSNLVIKSGVGASTLSTSVYDENQQFLGSLPMDYFTCQPM